MKRILSGAVLLLFTFWVNAQQDLLIGIAHQEGGSVFALDPASGKLETLQQFTTPISPQAGLTKVGDKLYGVSAEGGSYGYGTIFTVHVDGSDFEVLHEFDYVFGQSPISSLNYYNGKLYGTTYYGGLERGENGLLFSFDPETRDLQVLWEFEYEADGGYPAYDLLIMDDVLYGVCIEGGLTSNGTLFAYHLSSGEMQILHEFDGYDGSYPGSGPTFYDQKLYGVTSSGGDNDDGVVYSYDLINQQFELIHTCVAATGSMPAGELVALDSKLYGVHQYGGADGKGALYSIDPQNGTYTMLMSLNDASGSNNPAGLSLKGSTLIGINNEGGSGGFGNIFSFDPALPESYTELYAYSEAETGEVSDNVLIDGDVIYYNQSDGGIAGLGAVIAQDLTGQSLDFLKEFGEKGRAPFTNLLEIDGLLYGTLDRYGKNNKPVLFSMTKSGEDFKIITLLKDSNGEAVSPFGTMHYYDGKIYFAGTIYGLYGYYSCVMSVNPDGTDMTIIRQNQSSSFTYNYLHIFNGRLYLTFDASFDQTHKAGVFSMLPDGTDYRVHVNNLYGVGDYLVQIGDRLYTNTFYPWPYTRDSEIISFDLLGETHSIEADFAEEVLDYPHVLFAHDGYLYGFAGREYSGNVIFRFDPVQGVVEKLYDFSDNMRFDLTGGITLYNDRLYAQGNNSLDENNRELIIFSFAVDGTDYRVEATSFDGEKQYSAFALMPISRQYENNISLSIEETFTFGDENFELNASSASEAAIGYVSSDENILSISGNIATILGAGEVTITAVQAESDAYEAGESSFKLTIVRASQQIVSTSLPTIYTDAGTFDLSPYFETSSGLLLAYEVEENDRIAVSGHTLEIFDEGNILLTVSQPGDENYLPAADVNILLKIAPVNYLWENGAWYFKGALANTTPSETDDVVINAVYHMSELGAFQARSLTVSANGALYVDGDKTLAVKETVENYGLMDIASGSSLLTAAAGFTGHPVTIHRNTRFTDGRYSFVGSPVMASGSVTGALLGQYGYAYDESAAADTESLDRWKKVGNAALEPGRGYTTAGQTEVVFTGIPNSSEVIYPASYANDGWHMVSNPYPAAIALDVFLSENTTTTGAIYLWDDNGSNTSRGTNSDYVVANLTGAIDISGSNNAQRWNGYIAAMQGFFVQQDGAAGEVRFTPQMRVAEYNTDESFYRKNSEKPAVIRLNLTHQDGLFKQALIGWNDQVSDDQLTAGYDASVFDTQAKDLVYTVKSNTALGIQTVTENKQTIPVGLHVSLPGEYTLQLDATEAGGHTLYLLDQQTGQVTDATQGYTFYSDAGRFADRFVLSTTHSILGAALEQDQLYAADKTLYIRTVSREEKSYTIYSLSGQQMLQVWASGEAIIPMHQLPAGVYVVTDGENSAKILLR